MTFPFPDAFGKNLRTIMATKSSWLQAMTAAAVLVCAAGAPAATKVTFDANGVLELDGKKTFVVSFSLPPPPGGKTPEGKDGLAELRDAGANFMRIRPEKQPVEFDEAGVAYVKKWLDSAAAVGMHCWITTGELGAIKPNQPGAEAKLQKVIERFKNHPGLGAWKGYDEPAWVKTPAEAVSKAYAIFKQADPNHPVILIHAPMQGAPSPEPYMPACDITGVDIYRIQYPTPMHGDFGKELSAVADVTKWIVKASNGKPVWMTLQIAFGGTAAPGKILRFPTFAEERYMAYAAIINGARGINYQGGALPLTLNERDAKLGWNWTFWKKVMRQLIEEVGEKSPLYPALLAPESKLPIELEGANVEFCTREVGNEIFILAAKREGATAKAIFSGLPATDAQGTVLFEEPRKIEIKDGRFEDWFGPNEVHVYKLKRRG
jgi:hypothetical protein